MSTKIQQKFPWIQGILELPGVSVTTDTQKRRNCKTWCSTDSSRCSISSPREVSLGRDTESRIRENSRGYRLCKIHHVTKQVEQFAVEELFVRLSVEENAEGS
jgi:hypothetical protein